MSSKEIVAVDIDEVLFPFVDEFAKHHNELYGTKLRQSDFTSYKFEEVLAGSFEDALAKVYAFNELEHLDIAPLVDLEGLQEITDRYALVAVTARNPRFERQTNQWISQHFPNVFTDIKMIGYAPVMERPVTKVAVCLELGAIALIDDSVSHVSECAAEGVTGILFGDYPWNNTEILPPNVYRCTDWQQVRDCLNKQSA